MRLHSLLKLLAAIFVTFITFGVVMLGITHNPMYLTGIGINTIGLLTLIYLNERFQNNP